MIKSLKDALNKLFNLEEQLEAYEEFFKKFYVPRYLTRTKKEHQDIRNHVRKNPDTCDHLKGGPTRSPAAGLDYNVSHHKFIDGSERVRCLNCGRKWFKGKPDWSGALYMVKNSTNTRTSSEIPPIILNQRWNQLNAQKPEEPCQKP